MIYYMLYPITRVIF